VTVSDTLTATSQTLPHPATTSATAIKNTFTSSLASFAKYVRNVTTSAAGTGTAYSYNSINYYPAGVTAKPGDILEYILVSTNSGSGPVSAAVVTDVLPTSYVTLKANAYGSGKEVQYVPDSTVPATFSLFSAAAGDDAAVYVTSTLTVNVGGVTPPIPPAAGGTIAAGKSVLVLYQITVKTLPRGQDRQQCTTFLTEYNTATSAVTVTAISSVASFAKYVRNVDDIRRRHRNGLLLQFD